MKVRSKQRCISEKVEEGIWWIVQSYSRSLLDIRYVYQKIACSPGEIPHFVLEKCSYQVEFICTFSAFSLNHCL